ncbi:phosphodiesterase 2A [Rhinoraja longicauda]
MCTSKGKARRINRERGKDGECKCEQGQNQGLQTQVKKQSTLESSCAISSRPYSIQEDSLLNLASVIDTISLRTVINDALSAVIPKVEKIYTYLLDVKSSKLLCDNPPHEMSNEGRLREAVITKQRIKCNGLHKTDVQVPPMSHLVAPLPSDKHIMILPVIDTDVGKVISVILVYSGSLSNVDDSCLRILERHISAACKRVQTLYDPLSWGHFMTEQPPSKMNMVEGAIDELDNKVLKLCGELYDVEATSLQVKIIQYLQRETESKCCCMLVASEGDGHFFCQVVGEKVLREEIVFPLAFVPLKHSEIESKVLTMKDITNEQHKKLNSILGFEVVSMLCVPVVCRATGELVALGCAFNKNADSK